MENSEEQENVQLDINIDDLELDDTQTETEDLTAAQVIDLMDEAWINEKFSPEILPNKSEIVECLLGQISYMEENLENVQSIDFQKSIHQMEVDRLRFLVTSYLRNRIEKIELFVYDILKQEDVRRERNEELYLTENELKFAVDYKNAMEEHFENVLSFWPGISPTDWKTQPIVPNMYSFVFLKSKAEIEGVIIDDGNEDDGDLVDFKEGSQMIISYNSVSNLVKKGDVHLI